MPQYPFMNFKGSKRKLVIRPSAMTFVIVLLLGCLATCGFLPIAVASTGTQAAYATNFHLTENPISEGGKWINGGTVGLDWTNVQTTPGMAFGTEVGINSGSAIYDDSTAVLAGSWGPDQTAQATVQVIPHTKASSDEVELRLRTSISAHSITGYEVNFAVGPAQTYTEIVRWNGPLGSFTILSHQNTGGGVRNGDVIKATIIGNVIRVFKNGVQVNTATDSTYTTGNPGIGFYLLGSGGNSNYGLANFTATDASTITASATVQGTYTANFPLNENLISEGGNWINGGTVGFFERRGSTGPMYAHRLILPMELKLIPNIKLMTLQRY